MSNYTQTTFFTPKDSLPITDPNKTIFGAAYDVEFANISASLVTKLDSVFTNPALISLNITGAATPANGFALPSANTLAFYTNSTQRATWNASGTLNIAAAATNTSGLVLNGNNGTSPTLQINSAGSASSPDFLVAGNFNNVIAAAIQNLSTGTAGGATLDLQASNVTFVLSQLGSGNTSTFLTGGITGQSALLATTAAVPIQLGTNGVFAFSIDGTTQGIVAGSATGGQKGHGTINAQGFFVNGVSVATGAQVGSGTTTLNASGITVGQTYLVYRSANGPNITNNTTLANDGVMQLTSVPVGTYSVQAFASFQCATCGLKTGLAASSANGAIFATIYGIDNNTLNIVGQINGTAGPGNFGLGTGNSAGSPVQYQGQLIVTTSAITLSLQLAQSSSSATALVLNAGCWLAITRLA